MPSSEPVLEHHYGRDVWCDVEMDALRAERYLCLRCGRCKPGTDEHCPTAAKLYELCKQVGMAMMITRCAAWEPKIVSVRSSIPREELNANLAASGERMQGDVWCWAAHGETSEVCESEKAVVVRIDVPVELDLGLDRFRKNPVVMFDHDYDGLPVARCLWERVRFDDEDLRTTLTAKVQFHRDTELSREAWLCAIDGILSYWSISVLPAEWRADRVVTKADLINISLTPDAKDDAAKLVRLYSERAIIAPSLVKSLAMHGLLEEREVKP